jgi:hypothetical protein
MRLTMKYTQQFVNAIRFCVPFALLCSCTQGVSGGGDSRDDSTAQEQVALTRTEAESLVGSWKAAQVAALKSRIVAIARANQSQVGNEAQVTLTLRPLVDRLVRLAPQRTQVETLAAVQGPWYSLWSNLGFGRNAPNLTRIFQVVRTGYYYNISESTAPNGATVIGALRGAYTPIPGSLAIRFTKNAFLPGSLVGRSGADIATLADSIESKATNVIDVPGPIGVTGDLSVLYVDDTLRISGGSQTPVFDDNGTVIVPGQYNLLFVLERLQGTVK